MYKRALWLLLPLLACGDSTPSDTPANPQGGASGASQAGQAGSAGEAGQGGAGASAGSGGSASGAAGATQGGQSGAAGAGGATAGSAGASAGAAGAGAGAGAAGAGAGGAAGADAGGAAGAGAGGAAGAGAAGSGAGGEAGAGGSVGPIQAPPDTWTWVPVPGSRCASGDETGFGVRIRPSSKRLLIYVEGGGSCTSAQNCWITPSAANTKGYAAAEFKAESKLKNLPIFLDQQANPFQDASQVFIPYCTGDLHGGTTSHTLMVNGSPKETYFWGAKDLDLFLPMIAATFPGMDRAWLVGTSAGAAGSLLNYQRIRKALGVRLDTINDSGPPFSPNATPQELEFWGVATPEGCASCGDGLSIYQFNRSLDPSSRYGQMTFAYDPTASGNEPLEKYRQDLEAFIAANKSDPQFFSFVAANDITTAEKNKDHVILTNVTPGAFTKALVTWMDAFVNDKDAGQVVQPYP